MWYRHYYKPLSPKFRSMNILIAAFGALFCFFFFCFILTWHYLPVFLLIGGNEQRRTFFFHIWGLLCFITRACIIFQEEKMRSDLRAVHSFVIQELENGCQLPPHRSCRGVMERLWPQCLTPWLGHTLVIASLILEIAQMKSPWFSVRSLLLSAAAAAELSGFSYSWSDVPCSCSAERTEASVSAGSCLFFFFFFFLVLCE